MGRFYCLEQETDRSHRSTSRRHREQNLSQCPSPVPRRRPPSSTLPAEQRTYHHRLSQFHDGSWKLTVCLTSQQISCTVWVEVTEDHEDLCANGRVNSGEVEGPSVESLGPAYQSIRNSGEGPVSVDSPVTLNIRLQC